MTQSISFADFEQVDIRVGTVIGAEPFPEARKPAIKLRIDFGAELGTKSSSAQITRHYTPDRLIGRQVLAVVYFPPRQIGPFMSEVLTLGVPDPSGEVVLIRPDIEVPDAAGSFERARLMATTYATVTWDQLHRDARLLAEKLMPLGPFKGIVAITRGGLIPAAIIARELECRLVESISVVSYGGGEESEEVQTEPVVLKPASAAGDGEGFLIIDDLVDSGVTAGLVRRLLPRAHFACLYAKPSGKPATDSFVAEVSQDTWILFPWDTAPLFIPPLARGNRG